MADRGSAKQFIHMLKQAAPLDVLRLIDPKSFLKVSRGIAQVTECLDYTQRLLNIIGDKTALNPVMNVVSEAFSRRRVSGCFGNQSVKIDTLLNASTKGRNDNDERVARDDSSETDGSNNKLQVCFLFQANKCTFRNFRFRHECNLCKSTSHGMVDCLKRIPAARRRAAAEPGPPTEEPSRGPPHPRFRQDRAYNNRQ